MALRREVHFMKWNVIKSKCNSCKTQKFFEQLSEKYFADIS